MPLKTTLYSYRHWLIGLWLLAFAAYHLAWTAHAAAAFTLNGFDLAEQVGIHPAIQAENPAYRTAGLLRLPVPVIAFGLALTALLYRDDRLQWGWRALAVLIALRVIPPETALRDPGSLLDNPYATQLTFLTGLGLGLIALTVIPPVARWLIRYGWQMQVGLVVIGLILPTIGLERSLRLLKELNLAVSLGGGAVLYMVLVLAIGGLALTHRHHLPAR